MKGTRQGKVRPAGTIARAAYERHEARESTTRGTIV